MLGECNAHRIQIKIQYRKDAFKPLTSILKNFNLRLDPQIELLRVLRFEAPELKTEILKEFIEVWTWKKLWKYLRSHHKYSLGISHPTYSASPAVPWPGQVPAQPGHRDCEQSWATTHQLLGHSIALPSQWHMSLCPSAHCDNIWLRAEFNHFWFNLSCANYN